MKHPPPLLHRFSYSRTAIWNPQCGISHPPSLSITRNPSSRTWVITSWKLTMVMYRACQLHTSLGLFNKPNISLSKIWKLRSYILPVFCLISAWALKPLALFWAPDVRGLSRRAQLRSAKSWPCILNSSQSGSALCINYMNFELNIMYTPVCVASCRYLQTLASFLYHQRPHDPTIIFIMSPTPPTPSFPPGTVWWENLGLSTG